jgi:hypothetical protein
MRQSDSFHVGGLAYAKPPPSMLDIDSGKENSVRFDICGRMAFTQLPYQRKRTI